jgi:PAS domain-containing protein
MAAGLAQVLMIAGISVFAALGALALMGAFHARGLRRDSDLFGLAEEDVVFLFDGEDLVDATDAGRALLVASGVEGAPWARLMAYLSAYFPDPEREFLDLEARSRLEVSARGSHPLQLRAEWRRGLTRIALVDPEAEGARVTIDRLTHRATLDELNALRDATDHAPFPIWRQDVGDAGVVAWANPAYLMLVRDLHPGDGGMAWPLPQLFAPEPDRAHQDALEPQSRDDRRRGSQKTNRRKLSIPGRGDTWFEHVSLPVKNGVLHYALPAEAAVQAETALHSFVQTLTKTFAHLSTGLAIFDCDRKLVLFNPALTDLTALGVDFLSTRPTLNAFFDQLREGRMIPEPRDYKDWRKRISDLEKAAASGQYQETWTLPAGQTYRVTGRPHPDGAVAFLIDDISAEIALTRRFRSDLETGQAVIDTLGAAVAVFSSAGILVMSNRAYAKLWGVDPAATLGEIGIGDAMRCWQDCGGPPALWQSAREYVLARGSDAPWTAEAVLRDGRRLACRFEPIAGGAVMARFEVMKGADAPHGNAIHPDPDDGAHAARDPAISPPRPRSSAKAL